METVAPFWCRYLSKFFLSQWGMHQSQRSPTYKSFCRLRVSSSPRRLHRLYNEILGHNGAANVAPPPSSPRLFFPFLPSFQDEEWNAPQRIAFFSSRGNWGSRRGALWCYFPFRVGWRCLVAQLKMIIWEWNKVPPLEATMICRQPRSRLMSRGALIKMSYSYSGDDAASFVQLLSARGQIWSWEDNKYLL